MCERSEAANDVRKAAEALTKACQCVTDATTGLRALYPVPKRPPQDMLQLLQQIDRRTA